MAKSLEHWTIEELEAEVMKGLEERQEKPKEEESN